MKTDVHKVRIDKWLWAARFYKTRQLAVKALKSSQVLLNKQSIKPATNIKVGYFLKIKKGVYQIEIEVLTLSDKRGPASVAQTLYQETASSVSAREALKEQIANQPRIDIDRRKPDKRGVRSHRAIKRGGN